jgi:LacI family transcriptional regulator
LATMRMKGRVTMSAVAKRAGVHVTTVSLALRNHPSLPLATRERLRALADRMGYRPDPALSSLVAYRTGLRTPKKKLPLAYITNWDTEWGWKDTRAHARFFAGASARAPQLGYQLEHFWLGAHGLTHESLSQTLHARGITGLIIASHGRRSEHPLDLDWPLFSAVKIDFLPHEPAMHNVTNDQRAIIQLAMRHAIGAGYRRIGFVMSDWWDRCVDSAWSAGFLAERQTLASRDCIPILVAPDVAREQAVPRGPFERWFALQRPEVVIGNSSFVLPRLAEMKISVPKDVAFVDLFLDPAPDRRIAGIRQNCHRVGELAVEILVGQLHQHTFGLPPFPTSTLVEGTWFDGASLPPRNEPDAGQRSGRAVGRQSSSSRAK